MISSISNTFSLNPSSVATINRPDSDIFTTEFSKILDNSIKIIEIGETKAISGLNGNSALTDVVHSVLEAERTINLMISVREKALAAYQEISRMQI